MTRSSSGGGERSAAEAATRLLLLGRCQLLSPDGTDVTPRGRKARAVLAVLAMSAEGSVSRERLAGLMWSRHADEQARASLRQSLLEARRSTDECAPVLLDADRDVPAPTDPT